MEITLVNKLKKQSKTYLKRDNSIAKLASAINAMENEKRIYENAIKAFNEKRNLVDPQIAEAKAKLLESKKKVLKDLLSKLEYKSLRELDKDMIPELFNQQIERLERFGVFELDQEIENMVAELGRYAFSQMSDYDMEIAKMQFEYMKEEMGLETEMNLEEFYTNFERGKVEAWKQIRENLEAQEAEEKKAFQESKKHTSPNFKFLFRSLITKVHPDKTTDAQEKEKREILVKELNEAWENRNYHWLMEQWIKLDPKNEIGFEVDVDDANQLITEIRRQNKYYTLMKYELKDSVSYQFYYSNFRAKTPKTMKKYIEEYLQSVEIQLGIDRAYFNDTRTLAGFKSYVNDTHDQMIKLEQMYEDLYWEDDDDDDIWDDEW